MLTAYLDASGVTPADKHFVLAGFVAPTERWVEFEREWTALLAAPRYAKHLPLRNGKRYAHAKRIAQWDEPLREAFYGEANYLLRQVVTFGVAATYQHADYDYAFTGYPYTVKDSRYGLGFRCVMVSCCSNINSKHDNKPIAFFVEHGDPNQGGAKLILERHAVEAKMLADMRRKYNVLTFTTGFKEDWGALQAADMHAYSLLKHLLSPRSRGIDKSGRYFGDINLLLQEMQIVHFPLSRTELVNLRMGMELAILKPKLWGRLKAASVAAAKK